MGTYEKKSTTSSLHFDTHIFAICPQVIYFRCQHGTFNQYDDSTAILTFALTTEYIITKVRSENFIVVYFWFKPGFRANDHIRVSRGNTIIKFYLFIDLARSVILWTLVAFDLMGVEVTCLGMVGFPTFVKILKPIFSFKK